MDKSLSARVLGCCTPWGTEQLVPATLLPSQPKANSSASLAKAPPGKDAPHPAHRQPHMPSGDPSHCPSPQPIPLSIPTAHPTVHLSTSITLAGTAALLLPRLSPSQPFFWAWIGTSGMEKFSFPPEIPKSVSSGRDTRHSSPRWAPPQGSRRTQRQGGSLRNSSEGPGVPAVPTHSPWCFGAGTLTIPSRQGGTAHQWGQTCPCSTTPSTWGAVGVHGHGGWGETLPGGFAPALGYSRAALPQRNSFKKPRSGADSWCGAVQAQECS